MKEIRTYNGEQVPVFPNQKHIAVAGLNSYWLAGGRTSTRDEQASYRDPQHPTRLGWEEAFKVRLANEPADAVIVIAPDPGISINALRAAIDTKHPVIVVRESALHHMGRFERDSAEEQLYHDLLEKADVVVTLNAEKSKERSRAAFESYRTIERPVEVASRAIWIAKNSETLISASVIENADEKAFREMQKPVERLNPAKAKDKHVQAHWTLPLPSLKRETHMSMIVPNDENVVASFNEDTKTTSIQPNTLVQLKDIGSINFPRPNQLTQENTLRGLLALINSEEDPKSYEEIKAKASLPTITVKTVGENSHADTTTFTHINRDYAINLLVAAKEQSDGTLESVVDELRKIVTNELFLATQDMGVFAVDNTQVLSVKELVETFNEAPTAIDLPKEVIQACSLHNRLDAELLTRYVMAVNVQTKPTSPEMNRAQAVIDHVRSEGDVSEYPEDLVKWVKGRLANEIKVGESSGPMASIKVDQFRTATLTQLVQMLRTPEETKVTVANLRRVSPIINGELAPSFANLTHLDETQLFAGEVRAWADNVLSNGLMAGATFELEMQIIFQPALNQDIHPDRYRAENPEAIPTSVRWKNIPNSALTALRAGDLEPKVHPILHFPNTLRWLAQNPSQLGSDRSYYVRRYRIEEDGSIVKKAVQETKREFTELGGLAAGIFVVNSQDLEYAEHNGVHPRFLKTLQKKVYIDGEEQVVAECNIGTDSKGQYSSQFNGNKIIGQWEIGHSDEEILGLSATALRDMATELTNKHFSPGDATAVTRELNLIERALTGDNRAIQKLVENMNGHWTQNVSHEGTESELSKVVAAARLEGSSIIKNEVAARIDRYQHLAAERNRTNTFGEAVEMDSARLAELEVLSKEMDALKGFIKTVAGSAGIKSTLRSLLRDPKCSIGTKLGVLCGLPSQEQSDTLSFSQNPEEIRELAIKIKEASHGMDTAVATELVSNFLFGQSEVDLRNQIELQRQAQADEATIFKAEGDLLRVIQKKTAFVQRIENQRKSVESLAMGKIETNRSWLSDANKQRLASSIRSVAEGKKSAEEEAIALGDKNLTKTIIASAQALKDRSITPSAAALLAGYYIEAMRLGNPTTQSVCAEAILTAPKYLFEVKSALRTIGDQKQINGLGRIVQNHTIDHTEGRELANLILYRMEQGGLENNLSSKEDRHIRTNWDGASHHTKPDELSAEEKRELRQSHASDNRFNLHVNEVHVEERPGLHPRVLAKLQQDHPETRQVFLSTALTSLRRQARELYRTGNIKELAAQRTQEPTKSKPAMAVR